jgi:1,2-diacylglycerol 3-beta-glucosyltransferase
LTIHTLPISIWYFVYSTWWLFVYLAFSIARRRLVKFTALTPGSRTRRFVIMIPCHNEELVIANTVRSLMRLDYPQENILILVINDASTDQTGPIVRELQAEYSNVHLLERAPGIGGKGKSEALNAGYRWLQAEGLVSADETYSIGVCDADGWLDENMLASVEALFEDPTIGGCQAGVRIRNRDQHILLRYQDMEFALYSYITQSIRSLFGNASLGGNGQFISREALESARYTHNGLDYWWDPDSLTEDLDVGLRIAMNGYRIVTIPESFVHQQGLTDWRRLVFRQRVRWSWGTLQVTVKYLLSLRVYRDKTLTWLQKLDWSILLTLWGISISLPIVWGLSILHLLGVISVGSSLSFTMAILIGFAWIPLISLGLREIEEYQRWRVLLWATGFFLYLMHGIFCYYLALTKLIFFKPEWDKTDRQAEQSGTTV